MSRHKQEFFMVYNTDGVGRPTYEHDSQHSAVQEAKRLSRKHPGRHFVVLRSVVGFQVPTTEPMETTYVDLPF